MSWIPAAWLLCSSCELDSCATAPAAEVLPGLPGELAVYYLTLAELIEAVVRSFEPHFESSAE